MDKSCHRTAVLFMKAAGRAGETLNELAHPCEIICAVYSNDTYGPSLFAASTLRYD